MSSEIHKDIKYAGRILKGHFGTINAIRVLIWAIPPGAAWLSFYINPIAAPIVFIITTLFFLLAVFIRRCRKLEEHGLTFSVINEDRYTIRIRNDSANRVDNVEVTILKITRSDGNTYNINAPLIANGMTSSSISLNPHDYKHYKLYTAYKSRPYGDIVRIVTTEPVPDHISLIDNNNAVLIVRVGSANSVPVDYTLKISTERKKTPIELLSQTP